MGEDAREHVEGDQAVGIATLAIDGEGDTDAAEQSLSLGLFLDPQIRRHRTHPRLQLGIGRTNRGIEVHFVEALGHEFDLSWLAPVNPPITSAERGRREKTAAHRKIA
jgi:hypothetical protein